VIILFGLKNNVGIDIREKFSISLTKLKLALKSLNEFFNEVVILSTCNRTEIYFAADLQEKAAIDHIFQILNWDKKLMEYTFVVSEKQAISHIMKVSCGFHSKILGEDQILGQIKNAYEEAVEMGTVKAELQKLFQTAIGCGKEFRTVCQLYKIPVSAASIAVKDCIDRQIKSYMIIGYGEIGKLATKYVLDSKFTETIYIVVRDVKKVEEDPLIKSSGIIKLLTYEEKNFYYNDVQVLISCTSAPHTVVRQSEFNDLSFEKPFIIYDLAVPRDVDEEIREIPSVELFNIDNLKIIDKENKDKRKEIMYQNIGIVEKNIEKYMEWSSLREISPHIEKLKSFGNNIFEARYKVFKNKQHSKEPEDLAKVLIKSASDAYVNRAIEVLKEEKLKGREEECLRILERIFCE
jgi:glutamyl-tRNA reductase